TATGLASVTGVVVANSVPPFRANVPVPSGPLTIVPPLVVVLLPAIRLPEERVTPPLKVLAPWICMTPAELRVRAPVPLIGPDRVTGPVSLLAMVVLPIRLIGPVNASGRPWVVMLLIVK